MTKWKQLEEQLGGMFGRARLRANGHEVELMRGLARERLVIQVFVDGRMKGAWMDVDDKGEPTHSEGRFFCPKRQRLYKLKDYNKLKRVFGKRKADKMTALRTLLVSPHWNSARSLISHLKKHFPDLELLDREEVAS